MKLTSGALVLLACIAFSDAIKLQVSGTDLMYNGQKVYLNGPNIAWSDYGKDFGNGDYDGSLETFIDEISLAGGNSIRVWVHVEGNSTPIFDPDGYVTACDNTGQFIDDMVTLLDYALSQDVFVIFALWNGAVLQNQFAIDLVYDDSKTDSYFNECLIPLVQAAADHPALAAWEAVNEPEGSVLNGTADPNPCYDTINIGNSGAGWEKNFIPMERYLRFIGRHNQIFRQYDPTTLVTLGSWGHFPQSDAFYNTFNHYKDECLNGAAGGSNAHIDLYQMHSYDWDGTFSDNSPMTVPASAYLLDRPILMGEYSSVCNENIPLAELNQYCYDNGYAGGMSWHWIATGDCTDSKEEQQSALGVLANAAGEGGVVNVDIQ